MLQAQQPWGETAGAAQILWHIYRPEGTDLQWSAGGRESTGGPPLAPLRAGITHWNAGGESTGGAHLDPLWTPSRSPLEPL
eukprot:1005345-Pyramimonas_sp.AAC.1